MWANVHTPTTQSATEEKSVLTLKLSIAAKECHSGSLLLLNAFFHA